MIIAVWALACLIIIHILVHYWVECLDDTPDEYDDCYNCISGWCDADPGDEECERWRDCYGRDMLQTSTTKIYENMRNMQ